MAGPITSAMAGMLAALLSVVMIARPRVEMQISKMLQSAPESPNRPLLTTSPKRTSWRSCSQCPPKTSPTRCPRSRPRAVPEKRVLLVAHRY